MYKDEINIIAEAAGKKIAFLNRSRLKYLTASALAGLYVGFGILLIFVIGGMLDAANSPATKLVMGISFGIALSLVLMAGSELFTGNNLVMTVGALEKKVTWGATLKIWVYSFIGNLAGSVLLSWLFFETGLAKGKTAEFILKVAQTKMTAPWGELFFRGILCNILVCLAVWCFFKLKSESGKLIMIFWCLFAFITTGFEHSVANMTLLSAALFIPHSAAISLYGFTYNMTAVTLGNIVGGAFFVGFTYWFISKEKTNA